MKSFSFGTCRTQAAFWELNPVFGQARFDKTIVCHYASEIIQFIKFLDSKTRIPPSEYNKVFNDARNALMRKSEMQRCMNEADVYIIEISSIKNIKRGSVYYNLNKVPKSEMSEYELFQDSEDDIINKIHEMYELLG